MSLRKLQTSRRRSLNPLTGLFNIIESKPLSDKLILRVLFFAIVGSLLSAAILWNSNFIENTPAVGGTLIDGLIGTPRFINPALAVTRKSRQDEVVISSRKWLSAFEKLTETEFQQRCICGVHS